MMNTLIYNGQKIPSDRACIKYHDRGFMLGHGFFETILIKKGVAPALDYHWNRLKRTAPLVGIALPFSKQELSAMLDILINENNLQHEIAGARVTVTHGEAARGILPVTPPSPNFVISVFKYTPTPKKSFSALIATTRKNEHTITAQIKSISYLDNILAKQEAINQGYDEAILLNTALNVADGAITTIFMVKNKQIYTPLITDGALPGVIRAILLEKFKSEFSIVEQSISSEELFGAEEVFLTNALMGVQPISRINNTKYQVFSTSIAIAKKLREVMHYI